MHAAVACTYIFVALWLPPECAGGALPSKDEANAAWLLAQKQAHNCQRESMKAWNAEPKDEFASWAWHGLYLAAETRKEAWGLLWEVRSAPSPIYRRQQLAELIRMIGWEAVLNGRMPL